MSGGRTLLEPGDLPAELNGQPLASMVPCTLTEEGINFRSVVSEVERNLILQSLEITGGNKARAAQLLELKRTTFVEKLKRIQRGEPTYEL